MTTTERNGRGVNKKIYHYKIKNIHNDNDEFEYYKTIKDITEKYGISRGNVYLMIKNNENINTIRRRKYAHLYIQKINEHYLTIEQGIDPSQILV